jgi:hypothetical protein
MLWSVLRLTARLSSARHADRMRRCGRKSNHCWLTKMRRALMRSQDALANWLERRGEVALYRPLLESAEALLAADPDNVRAQGDLAARHTRMRMTKTTGARRHASAFMTVTSSRS